MRWKGYSYAAQSVSELRAIGVPARYFLIPILFIYTLLEVAFGFGICRATGQKRGLRIAGGLLIGLGLMGTPCFQLNLGDTVGSFANTLHILLTAVTMLVLLLIVGYGAMADGNWFHLYSYATFLVFVVTGVWTFMELP